MEITASSSFSHTHTHTHTHTCHAMALHAAHFVLRFQRGQQGSTDGDAIHHGAELEDDGLLLQAFGKLRELIGFHGGLIDAGCFLRGLRGGCVFPIRRLTVRGEKKKIIHSLCQSGLAHHL